MPQQWLKLMRYNKSLFGYTSEVDHPSYFLATNGKTDPVAEMAASIEAFKKPLSKFKNPNKHPICLFPGRYLYLKRLGKIKSEFNHSICTDFSTFKKKIELNSVSIIFSSYYIDKPASAFGHTLLKLNKEDPLTGDLKSYGVDFSAQVTTTNPLSYGVLGIFGGFYGRFSLLPYFLKLREYNDYESRDLWEFELNLDESDLELLVAHLWDMNLALFDYYYFTENCSYHITRFIDAIKPSWGLLDDLYSFVIPVDTLIPLFKKDGITKGVYYRASLEKRLAKQLEQLNSQEIDFVKKSFNNLKIAEDKKNVDRARALDALIDFTDYKYPTQLHISKNNEIQDFKREVLIERSQLSSEPTIKTRKVERPSFDYAHLPRKVRIGKSSGDLEAIELEHRFSLHNTLEPTGDIYSNFSLEMGKTVFSYNEETEKLKFDSFEVALVEALRPVTSLEKRLSWQFNFGIQNRFSTISPYLNLNLGASFNLWKSNFGTFLVTENSHFLTKDWKRLHWAGVHLQWQMLLNDFGFKTSYKRMRDLVAKKNNIEIFEGEFVYNISSRFQLSSVYLNKVDEEIFTASLSIYY
jgi:hypothetical protein